MIPKGSAELYFQTAHDVEAKTGSWRIEQDSFFAPGEIATNSTEFQDQWASTDKIESFNINLPRGNFQNIVSEKKKRFGLLTFGRRSRLTLRNATVSQIRFQGDNFEASDCHIGELVLEGKGNQLAKVQNCQIGRLVLGQLSSMAKAEFHDCKILTLGFTLGSPDRPAFDLFFNNYPFETRLETREAQQRIKEAEQKGTSTAARFNQQSFRDLHSFAEKHGMSQIAHMARGTELGLEYSLSPPGFEKFALLVWRTTSDFGLSPQKALRKLLILTICLWLSLWCCGTVVLPGGPTWVASLNDGSRALIAALSNLVFPYAGISARSIVQPANAASAILMTLHGLITIALILFVGFGLRRRFKLG